MRNMGMCMLECVWPVLVNALLRRVGTKRNEEVGGEAAEAETNDERREEVAVQASCARML